MPKIPFLFLDYKQDIYYEIHGYRKLKKKKQKVNITKIIKFYLEQTIIFDDIQVLLTPTSCSFIFDNFFSVFKKKKKLCF